MNKNQKQFRKPGRFPADVARFFNPHKTGSNTLIDEKTGQIIKLGTHQAQKARERSYIPVVMKEA